MHQSLDVITWRRITGSLFITYGSAVEGHWSLFYVFNYNDVIMSAMASQITSLTIVYSTVYSGADQRKHQSSASLSFVRGIHRWPVNSPHKRPITRKMFPFDDVIMFVLGLNKLLKGCRSCRGFETSWCPCDVSRQTSSLQMSWMFSCSYHSEIWQVLL